jgi:hypothetical protein
MALVNKRRCGDYMLALLCLCLCLTLRCTVHTLLYVGTRLKLNWCHRPRGYRSTARPFCLSTPSIFDSSLWFRESYIFYVPRQSLMWHSFSVEYVWNKTTEVPSFNEIVVMTCTSRHHSVLHLYMILLSIAETVVQYSMIHTVHLTHTVCTS